MTTAIEWVQNPDGTRGVTLNSKTGCKNHTPEGLCLGGLFPCYAYRLANGRLKQRYLANTQFAIEPLSKKWMKAIHDPFYPRWWPQRLEEIRKRKTPSGIFLDDMSDWMGDYWPNEWTRQELQVMRDCPQHRFYTLTKQPQNLAKWSPFPSNCWVGVTATNFDMSERAISFLKQIKAKVKFISYEPLLDKVTLYPLEKGVIDWLIIGAQTKPTKYPAISWLQEIIEAADRAGVKVFLKDNLMPLFSRSWFTGRPSDDWAWQFIDGKYELRQELPK